MSAELTFMVVEDERLVALALSRALSSYGRVAVVGTVDEARRCLEEHRFDALIVDVQLPDGSGFDVLDFARRRMPEIEALVLSGNVDAARLSRACTLGVTYLMKPVVPSHLHDLAHRARARRLGTRDRLRSVVATWAERYALTLAEQQILTLAMTGLPRVEIASRRDVTLATLKKQVQSLIGKTGDPGLESAANRALRAALEAKG